MRIWIEKQCGMPDFTSFATMWLVKILLHFWHEGQRPFTRDSDQLMDHDLGLFDLQGEILEITVENIYFITWLSCKGIPVNLEGTGRSGTL